MKRIILRMSLFLILFCTMIFFVYSFALCETEVILPSDTVEKSDVSIFSQNEDSLAEAYIVNTLPHKTIFRMSRPSGYSLTGANKKLYTALQNVVTAVAEGEKTSTEFSFSASSIFDQIEFSAEELGVEELITDGVWNEEAITAMRDIRSSLDIPTVMTCIIQDSPYQLYWFGKRYSYTSCDISGNQDHLVLSGSITVNLVISVDYAATTINEEGETIFADYEVDPIYGTSVAAAAENAAKILERYEGLDDYSRLQGYRNEICSMTSYNTDAVNNGYPYGNPWQIVWVFDGNPETKVVCEGYSKAFQYLNDMSVGSAEVICVQGYLNEAVAEHAHMWNVATLDGHNYLVDLTNGGTTGLFLAGYSDGDPGNGYYAKNGERTLKFIYNRNVMHRTEEELKLENYSYDEWRESVTTAPSISLSSITVFPGHLIGVRINSLVPAQALIIRTGEIERTVKINDRLALFELETNGEIQFAAVIDGITTPFSYPVSISTKELPKSILTVPTGASILEEAFSGIGAETVILENATVAENAFDDLKMAVIKGDTIYNEKSFNADTILVFDKKTINAELFDSAGYGFVIEPEDILH